MRSPLLGNYARANTTGQIDGRPKLVTFFQPQLEEALRARLAQRPSVEVRTGVEVTGLEQGDGSVRLDLRAGQEVGRVEASYVVGCDGANSFVRRAIGLAFAGRTFTEDWLVVDVCGAPEPIDHVEFWCDPSRPSAHMPAPGGRQRWEFNLRRGETREQMERPEVVHALLRPWTRGAPVELEIKPVNDAREGLFRRRSGDRLRPGTAFAQALVAHAGQVKPSDDVLGDAMCLVGFGADPTSFLGPTSRARWRALGGRFIQIAHRGQQLNLGPRAERCEDLTGRFLPASRSLGWAAVVRPDRMVLCEGPVRDSAQIVDETLALLNVPPATLRQRNDDATSARAHERT